MADSTTQYDQYGRVIGSTGTGYKPPSNIGTDDLGKAQRRAKWKKTNPGVPFPEDGAPPTGTQGTSANIKAPTPAPSPSPSPVASNVTSSDQAAALRKKSDDDEDDNA